MMTSMPLMSTRRSTSVGESKYRSYEKPAQPPPQVAGTIKPVQPLRAAIEKIDASDFKPTTSSRNAPRRAAQDSVSKQSPAFFKSGTGITVLAVVAAGVGYALYSTSHDRVNSPGKE